MSSKKDSNNVSCLELHLGTDLLISAWLLFISASIAFGVFSNNLIEAIVSSDATLVVMYDVMLFVSGFIYAMAGYVFVIASYEENITIVDPEKLKPVKEMSFLERYFIGNNLLIMAWLLLIATVPILSYPIIEFSRGMMSNLVFIFLVTALSSGIAVLLLWVVSCFPENMMLNGGNGSSYAHNIWISISTCCCASSKREGYSNEAKLGDFLLVSWIIAVGAVLSIPVAVYVITKDPSAMPMLMLVSDTFFALGSILFVYTIYPNHSNSSIVWYWLSCCSAESEARQTCSEESNSILRHSA